MTTMLQRREVQVIYQRSKVCGKQNKQEQDGNQHLQPTDTRIRIRTEILLNARNACVGALLIDGVTETGSGVTGCLVYLLLSKGWRRL